MMMMMGVMEKRSGRMRWWALAAVAVTCLLGSLALTPAPCSALYKEDAGVHDWVKQHIGHVQVAAEGNSGELVVATHEGVVARIDPSTSDIVWRVVLREVDIVDDLFISSIGNDATVVVVCGGAQRVLGLTLTDGVLTLDASPGTIQLMDLPYNQIPAAPPAHEPLVDRTAGTDACILRHSSGPVVATLAASRVAFTSLITGATEWSTDLSDRYAVLSLTCGGDKRAVFAAARAADEEDAVVVLEINPTDQTTKQAASGASGDVCTTTDKAIVCATTEQQGSTSLSIAPLSSPSKSHSISVPVADATSLKALSDGSLVVVGNADADTAVVDVGASSSSLVTGKPTKSAVFLQRTPRATVVATQVAVDDKLSSMKVNNGATERVVTADVSSLHLAWGRAEFAHCSKTNKLCLVVFGDSTLAAVRNDGTVAWVREEALADVETALFVDLPPDHDEGSIFEEQDPVTRFVRRVAATVHDLSHTLATAATSSPPSQAATASENDGDDALVQDYFNTNKMVVAVTRRGRVVGFLARTGRVVWARSPVPNKVVTSAKLLELRTAAHMHALVALVASSSDGSFVFFFNPVTGETIGDFALPDTTGAGIVDMPAPALHACLVPHVLASGHTHVLAILTSDMIVHTFPRTEDAGSQLVSLDRPFFVHTIDTVRGVFTGYRLLFDRDHTGVAERMWRVEIDPSTEHVVAVTQPDNGHVASLGQILADKAVLYKYLNPHLIAFATLTNYVKKSATMTVYLLDTVKGTFIERVQHQGVRGPVHMCMAENWVLYTYRNRKMKRHELSVIELFDSTNKLKEEGRSFSSLHGPKPIVMKQSYIFPTAVTAMGVSRTELGVAERQALLALANGGVFAINKKWFDARRPATPKAAERVVDLPKYEPMLPVNTLNVISYNQTISGVRGFVTAPTGLESTSLVMAHGLDTFVTRVNPSGQFDSLDRSFNRVALLGTLAALMVATYVLSKLSARKALDKAWQ